MMGRTNATPAADRPRHPSIEELTPMKKLRRQEEQQQVGVDEYPSPVEEESTLQQQSKLPPPFEPDDDETMDQEDEEHDDVGSVPTTSAVRALDGPGGYSYFRLPLHRQPPCRELKSKEFIIPRTPTEIAAAVAEATEAAVAQQQQYAQQQQQQLHHEMQQDDYEDDISILTEYSGMEEEEDESSQVTAGTETRTVVTTTTGSTTIPTRNAGQYGLSSPTSSLQQQYAISKRRNAVVDPNHGLPPLDNSQYKRRKML